ncbi:hypothetical protein F4808DRAFT_419928 [Astrocystis sublimbata]|nr:hypothetical protein F4808DRAFT_419928 [Astrocystis sublimbata]
MHRRFSTRRHDILCFVNTDSMPFRQMHVEGDVEGIVNVMIDQDVSQIDYGRNPHARPKWETMIRLGLQLSDLLLTRFIETDDDDDESVDYFEDVHKELSQIQNIYCLVRNSTDALPKGVDRLRELNSERARRFPERRKDVQMWLQDFKGFHSDLHLPWWSSVEDLNTILSKWKNVVAVR